MVTVAIEPEMDMSHLNSCQLVLVAYFDSCHCAAVDSHLLGLHYILVDTANPRDVAFLVVMGVDLEVQDLKNTLLV